MENLLTIVQKIDAFVWGRPLMEEETIRGLTCEVMLSSGTLVLCFMEGFSFSSKRRTYA